MTSLDLSRQAGADPRGSERPGQGRRGHAAMRGSARRCRPSSRRSTRKAHACCSCRTSAGPRRASSPRSSRSRRSRKRLTQLLGVPVPLKRDWLDGVDGRARARWCCSRTCASTRARRRTPTTLARKMAALCDVYVMDAFGTAHRAEASTHGVAKYAPVACAGPLLVSELTALETALDKPGAAAARDRRRLEGVDQAHGARVAARARSTS